MLKRFETVSMIQSRKLKASIVILKATEFLTYLLTFSTMVFTLRRITNACLLYRGSRMLDWVGVTLCSYLVVLDIYLTFISK